MIDLLRVSKFHASEGQSLGSHEELPDNNRRSLHEEDHHLNACRSDRYFDYAELRLQQLDRRRRRGLIGRPGRTLEPEAASGGPRYSASANQGPLASGRSQ